MSDLVSVRVRECPDGSHPDGDTVSLHPTLSLEGGTAAMQDYAASLGDASSLTQRWLRTFVRYGAADWTLHDPGGEPWPFDVERLLSDFALSWAVAAKADDLYGEAVLLPLGLAPTTGRTTSSDGSTTGPTSPATTSTRRRRRSS